MSGEWGRSLLNTGGLISAAYTNHAIQSHKQLDNLFKSFIAERKLPKEGWDDNTINYFLQQISFMDSNNFLGNIGVGEREGRVYSSLVKSKNYNLAHGIGRSGEINAEQPKAAGSSLVLKLCNYLVLDAFKLSGLQNVKSCVILPLATGMALSLCLLALKQTKPNAQYVIWPRIDQKTCLKCIITAGLKPIVIENRIENDEIRTDLDELEKFIKELGQDSILCVLSTTSCFSPRAPDRIIDIAKICANYNIGHIVNNAYGLQSTKFCHLITEATRLGRVDAFVQSTDKNFMVPVGGAIAASSNKDFIDSISKLYPGRASMSPILDLFITLLSMGESGYRKLLDERKQLLKYFTDKLSEFATAHNERLLQTPNNPVSLAMTVSTLGDDPTFLGSMLFSRGISGTRICSPNGKKTVCDIEFKGYGTHINNYPVAYLNAACAIGITKGEIDTFIEKLDVTWRSFMKQKKLSINNTKDEDQPIDYISNK